MLRAWLLWLLAAACCVLAFAFTHAGAALAALCVPVLAALAGFVVLRCSRLPALSLRLPAGGRKDGMIAGEIAASRRAPGRVLCRIEVRNDLTGETTEFFAEERFSFRAEHCGRLTVRIRRAWLLGLPGLFAPIADFRLLETAVEVARRMGVEPPVGNLLSSDVFYDKSGRTMEWGAMGVLAVEMETAALYCNAAEAGKRALTICTVSDSLVTGEELSAADRQTTFTRMMEIALETAVEMAKQP